MSALVSPSDYADEQFAAMAWAKDWYTQIARKKQIAPRGDWARWLVLAGRGWGKSKVGGYWIALEAWRRPGTIGHVIAPTWSDVINTCFEGPAGILSHTPPELIASWSVSEAILEFKNGSKLRGFSAEKPDRLRGPQAHYMWADELCAWQYLDDTWDMAMFGLRLGEHVKAVVTTTPKAKPLLISMLREAEEKNSKTLVTRGSTYENRANLAPNFFDDLVTKYEGTTLGRQELNAEIIDPAEQGIIKKSWIQLWPFGKKLPAFRFVVLSLDTAFTEATRDKKTGDADPTAGTVWGVFEHPDQPGRDCVLLLDCWQEWLGLPDLLIKVRKELTIAYGEQQAPLIASPYYGRPALSIAGGRKPDLLIIEDKGSGVSLRQTLARESIEAFPYNPGNAKKVDRLHAVSHFFANGIVWVMESEKRPGEPASWTDEKIGDSEGLITQLCTFSGEGSIKHDDYVDSCTQAIRYLTDRDWVTIKPRERKDPAVAAYQPPRSNPYKR